MDGCVLRSMGDTEETGLGQRMLMVSGVLGENDGHQSAHPRPEKEDREETGTS